MFAHNIFPKTFDKVAQKCYTEQMDAFARLFEDPQFYKTVMEATAKAMYFKYKNDMEQHTEVMPYETKEMPQKLSLAADEEESTKKRSNKKKK